MLCWGGCYGDVLLTFQACVALLNDSWEFVSMMDRPRTRLAPLKTLLFDILSLALSLAGVIMLLFSDLAYDGYGSDGNHDPSHGGSFGQTTMTGAAMWLLAALV